MLNYYVECYMESCEILHFNQLDREIGKLWGKEVNEDQYVTPSDIEDSDKNWLEEIMNLIGFISYDWNRLCTHTIAVDELIDFKVSVETENYEPVELIEWIERKDIS